MKMKLTPIALAMTVLLGAAHAQSTSTLPEVHVHGNRPLPQSASALTEDDLYQARAATSDTAGLLLDVPGLSLYGAGGVSGLPAIHGLADDRLRIKVDGMDLAAACPNHMNPPLSYLNPSAVGSLQIYAGITPVSVGGDSVGGTIMAETRTPAFADAGQPARVDAEVGAFYRSNGGAHGLNTNLAWASDVLSVQYSAAVAQADNYVAAADFKTSAETGRAQHTLSLREVGSSAYLSRNQTLALAFRHDRQLVDVRVGYQDIPYELYPNQRMDMLGNTGTRTSLRYQGEFDWGGLETRVYHESVTHHMDFGADKKFNYGVLMPPNTSGASYSVDGMPMDTASQTTGATLKANINVSQQAVVRLGAEYLRYRLDDWWPPAPDCGVGNCVGGMAPLEFQNINGGQRDRLAAFAEWEATLTPQWGALAGVRIERVSMGTGPVHGYSEGTTPLNTGMMRNMYEGSSVGTRAAFNAMDRQRTDNNVDITLMARHASQAGPTVELGYARKTRSPNLYERYSWSRNAMALEMNNFVGDGNGYLGNPDLKPEVAHILSATANWRSADGAAGFTITPYAMRVQDFIDVQQWNRTTNVAANPIANGTFVTLKYQNVAARLAGVDVVAHAPIAHTGFGAWHIRGMMNYASGRNLDADTGLYNIMPLNTKLTLTHESGAWASALELVGVHAKTDGSEPRNEIRTPGYGLVHLRSSYAWQRMRLDIGVENLLDRFYILPTGGAYVGQGATMSFNRETGSVGTNGGTASYWGTGVPGPGRSIYVGLNVKF